MSFYFYNITHNIVKNYETHQSQQVYFQEIKGKIKLTSNPMVSNGLHFHNVCSLFSPLLAFCSKWRSLYVDIYSRNIQLCLSN